MSRRVLPYAFHFTQDEHTYSVRFVHKVSSKPTGAADSLCTLQLKDVTDRYTLAKALRDQKVLLKGARVYEYRVTKDKIVAFPTLPGCTTYHHSVILTKVLDEENND